MQRLVLVLLFAALLLASGCNGGCPEVKTIDSSVSPPGLIQMLFSVECKGEPVTSVDASDLTLTEGGLEVSSDESEWRLDPVTAALETYTLLLLDVSDSIIEQGTLETAQEVATDFVRAVVAQGQQVSVAVFDGDPEIRTVAGFTSDLSTLEDAIADISAADQRDPSTNLNGAIVAGLEILDGIVDPDVEAELVSVANMVVFTDGRDRAGRVTHTRAVNAVEGSDHEVFVVALIDPDADGEELQELGEDGFFRADALTELTATFEELISRLAAEVNKYYRVSFCSPLRSPQTRLKVTVAWENSRDTISLQYQTKDFGPGCALPPAGP